MAEPDIELDKDQRALFGQISLEWDHRVNDHEAFARNGEAAVQLMTRLLARKAIPEARLKYFTDPGYRTGRLKGSRRDIFHRNGNTDDEMMRSYSFLQHLRYLVCGPNIPLPVISEFREAVQRCGHVSSGDSIELSDLARRQVRAFGLAPHDVAEEYFKLSLDCGMWVQYALRVQERVKKAALKWVGSERN
jgi:hypothetical protein